MRKTPSYLKGLAETRARAAGDVLRLERQNAEIESLMAELRTELLAYQQIYDRGCERLTGAQSDLVSCDRLIRKFDSRLDPADIAPIRAHKGRYGGYGRLVEAIKDLLKTSHPEIMTTERIALILELEFDVDFATPQQRKKWAHNSIGNPLKKMVAQGLVERLHDPRVLGRNIGRWRWKPDGLVDLQSLQKQADAAGLGANQAKRRGRPPKKLASDC